MKDPEFLQKKAKYWKIVDEILRKSDLILNILDSRFDEETRNKEIEEKIKRYGKKFIFVLNKSDLVSRNQRIESVKKLENIAPVVPVSCRERHGKLKLISVITRITKKRPLAIGVVGYPNTGKSSVINYLKGRKAARTSPIAGFTKGMQWIKLSKNIKLIDTPGVIPFKEKNEAELAIKSSLTNIKDYENVACKIIELLINKNKKILEEKYEIKASKDSFETLKKIAKSKHKLKKHGELDLEAAARMIVNDFQKSKIRI